MSIQYFNLASYLGDYQKQDIDLFMIKSDKLVSDNFEVPETLETKNYRLRMLTVNDVLKDYLAVISSKDQLIDRFDDDSLWPEGLTFEQNLIDLGW